MNAEAREARFWARVAGRENPDGCWIWTGSHNPHGYGHVKRDGRNVTVHRYVYTMLVGPTPEGTQLDHLCRVRDCVNPRHLEPVTSRQNTLRSPIAIPALNAQKEACPQGHPYSEENLVLYTHPIEGRTRRRCRQCGNDKRRQRRARARQRGDLTSYR